MKNPATFREEAAVVQPLLATCPLVRAINFHNTPQFRVDQYHRQLQQCQEAFAPVNENDLDRYLATGRWHKAKPGLIVALYNGYRDNYDVFRPLLEQYGFTGWFFVATAFVGTPAAEQPAFIARRKLTIVPNEYSDGRFALSWGELKELDRNHVIASHTRNHSQIMTEDMAALESEIVGPQHDFEAHLGHRVRSFASLSGSAYGEYPKADQLIKTAGYQFVFSNLKIQRLRES